jgi:hypothetical protein
LSCIHISSIPHLLCLCKAQGLLSGMVFTVAINPVTGVGANKHLYIADFRDTVAFQ